MNAVRLGLARGGVDLRHSVTYWPDLTATVFFPLLQVTVLLLMRGHHVPGTSFSLGSLTLPSGIGMALVFGGMVGEYSPSLYLALRIAAYFEVPVEVIFATEPFPRLGSASAGSASGG